jgi:hypothetical protein
MRKAKKTREIDPSEGRIFRDGSRVIVERVGATSLKDLDGVECRPRLRKRLNPPIRDSNFNLTLPCKVFLLFTSKKPPALTGVYV